MRVWERGVGETLSCGTGACASAAVAHRRGLVGDRVAVHVPGGDLVVELGATSASAARSSTCSTSTSTSTRFGVERR